MELFSATTSAEPVDWYVALVALLLAFGLSQVISGVYMWTFRGMSYSRSFVVGMASGSVVTCMLMLAIGDSIAAGIGLAGGLSIVRFRTTMRDPRDMVFVFATLGVGIVCGLRAYPVAIMGTLVFCMGSLLMHVISYGTRRQFDGLIRFVAPQDDAATADISTVLRRHTGRFVLVTLREVAQGNELEHAYQVQIPDPKARTALVSELEKVGGLRDVTLHMQEPSLTL